MARFSNSDRNLSPTRTTPTYNSVTPCAAGCDRMIFKSGTRTLEDGGLNAYRSFAPAFGDMAWDGSIRWARRFYDDQAASASTIELS